MSSASRQEANSSRRKRQRTSLILEGSTMSSSTALQQMAVVRRPRGTGNRRPIDKVLPNIAMDDLVATQQTQDLVTPNAPCTIMGMRWQIGFRCNSGTATASGSVAWAIIILRDGRTANTMSFTGGSNLYEPEQDVLAFGRFESVDDASDSKFHEVGQTKTMRKLRVGDKITFIALGTASNETRVRGTVQLFCKF